MPLLPVGFFMPLPLPIMIPFMMWQSAAIAAGFGTYFQFAKRRVSAMSNEEFNKADPHELVNSMYEDIVRSIPDSFAKVDSLTPVILQSMNVMLDQAVKWLQNVITGNITGEPSQPSLPSGGGDFTPDTNELLSLTIQFISTMNDLSLEATVRNISDYNKKTQNLLLAEQARRKRTGEPVIEPSSEAQQTTKLNSEFVATLTQNDLETGGSRVRNYKGKIQKWKGIFKVQIKPGLKMWNCKWNGRWECGFARTVVSIAQADGLVNKFKLSLDASYVLAFGRTLPTYYLIKDDF